MTHYLLLQQHIKQRSRDHKIKIHKRDCNNSHANPKVIFIEYYQRFLFIYQILNNYSMPSTYACSENIIQPKKK